jgi:hypothetical protein
MHVVGGRLRGVLPIGGLSGVWGTPTQAQEPGTRQKSAATDRLPGRQTEDELHLGNTERFTTHAMLISSEPECPSLRMNQ